jgi:hypothetical protein
MRWASFACSGCSSATGIDLDRTTALTEAGTLLVVALEMSLLRHDSLGYKAALPLAIDAVDSLAAMTWPADLAEGLLGRPDELPVEEDADDYHVVDRVHHDHVETVGERDIYTTWSAPAHSRRHAARSSPAQASSAEWTQALLRQGFRAGDPFRLQGRGWKCTLGTGHPCRCGYLPTQRNREIRKQNDKTPHQAHFCAVR